MFISRFESLPCQPTWFFAIIFFQRMRTPPLHHQPPLTKSPERQPFSSNWPTKLCTMPCYVNPRTVVGGWVHALSYHVTSEAKAKRVYGLNWKSATINGTVLEVRKRTKDNNKNVQTYVYASYMFSTQVSRSKELHLKSVKKFWPTDEPATTTVPPQSEVGPTINQPW